MENHYDYDKFLIISAIGFSHWCLPMGIRSSGGLEYLFMSPGK